MSNEEPAEAESEEPEADVEDEVAADDATEEEEVAAEAAESADEETKAEDGEAEAAAGDEEAAEDADESAEGDADDEPDEEPEGLQEGDFVRLAYTARTVDGDQLVDTTDVEVAEEEGVDTEGQNIEPRVIVLGAGHIFGAVEGDIVGKEPGDEGSVTIPAADAFGEYDPDQVRTVSAEKIPEDSRHPGGHVDIDGQHGHVETIIGGRARVDFNHMLAGEDVEYDYEILEEVEDRIEKAKGLLGMYVDVDLDMHIETDEEEQAVYDDEGEEEGTETVELETLYIEAAPQLAMNQQWLFQKSQIAQELIDRLEIDRVIVQEVLDGAGGMMGGLGGLGGMGGVGGGDIEDLEDVDAEELVEELGEDVDAGDLDLDEIEE